MHKQRERVEIWPKGPGVARCQPGPLDQRIQHSAVEAEGREPPPVDERQAESRADRHEPADDVGGRTSGCRLGAHQLEVERLAHTIHPRELGVAAVRRRVQVAHVDTLAIGGADAEDRPVPATDAHGRGRR